MQELATKILKIKLPYFHNKKGRPRKGLTSVEEDWLVEFFEHPGITRSTPGRKENDYVGKMDGKKTYLPKALSFENSE